MMNNKKNSMSSAVAEAMTTWVAKRRAVSALMQHVMSFSLKATQVMKRKLSELISVPATCIFRRTDHFSLENTEWHWTHSEGSVKRL
jgi:hypothetical protein